MALPCMVYEQDEREAVHHFRTLAAGTGLPIMIYNNPLAYKVDLKPEGFLGLVESANIVAIKESSHDSRRMTDSWNVLGDRFLMFCGVDDLIFENMLCGAVGWVSGLVNSFPAEGVRLFELTRAGRIEEARDLYRWFMPLLHLDVHKKLVQYIKLANQMTGMGAEWVRAPRLPLVGEERARGRGDRAPGDRAAAGPGLSGMPILLGAIADDFTGATDLCSMLVRNGMRTVQLIGVPEPGMAVPDADAVVVALKSRTAPVAEAVARVAGGAALAGGAGGAAVPVQVLLDLRQHRCGQYRPGRRRAPGRAGQRTSPSPARPSPRPGGPSSRATCSSATCCSPTPTCATTR